MNTLTSFIFDGKSIAVVERGGQFYVGLRSVCAALDIDWSTQRKLMLSDHALSPSVVTFTTEGTHGTVRDTLCLPLDYLNGWLFRLRAENFSEPKRSRIIRYQRECYRVLADHFLRRPAVPAGATAADLEEYRREFERAANERAARIRFDIRTFCRQRRLTQSALMALASEAFEFGPSTVGAEYSAATWNVAPAPREYLPCFRAVREAEGRYGLNRQLEAGK